jgi:hypothetical protein
MDAFVSGWTESPGATVLRLGQRAIGQQPARGRPAFRGRIRSVASITICRPFQIALYSIDHTAISACAAVTEN